MRRSSLVEPKRGKRKARNPSLDRAEESHPRHESNKRRRVGYSSNQPRQGSYQTKNPRRAALRRADKVGNWPGRNVMWVRPGESSVVSPSAPGTHAEEREPVTGSKPTLDLQTSMLYVMSRSGPVKHAETSKLPVEASSNHRPVTQTMQPPVVKPTKILLHTQTSPSPTILPRRRVTHAVRRRQPAVSAQAVGSSSTTRVHQTQPAAPPKTTNARGRKKDSNLPPLSEHSEKLLRALDDAMTERRHRSNTGKPLKKVSKKLLDDSDLAGALSAMTNLPGWGTIQALDEKLKLRVGQVFQGLSKVAQTFNMAVELPLPYLLTDEGIENDLESAAAAAISVENVSPGSSIMPMLKLKRRWLTYMNTLLDFRHRAVAIPQREVDPYRGEEYFTV